MRAIMVAGIGWSSIATAGPAVVVEGTSAPPVDPLWRLDVVARGVASVALGDTGSMRSGVAPALAIRAERRAGPIELGGTIAAALPAWAGALDATVSADVDLGLAPRWRLALGADAGVSLYLFDAGLGDSAPPNALVYWGPLARVRAQIVYLCPQPNGRAVGLVAGPLFATTWAHDLAGDRAAGIRLEPGVEVGLALRL